MCQGGELGARRCNLAVLVECSVCLHQWEPDDMGNPEDRLSKYTGGCPECGSSGIVPLRCDRCPVAEMEWQRGNSAAGRLLEQALDRRFDLKEGVGHPEITADEALALRIMQDEERKWEAELNDRQRQEMKQMELERRMMGQGQGAMRRR